ncbi:MAG: helix-turn-helix domain-containing protein [Longimicrobiales bacterium]
MHTEPGLTVLEPPYDSFRPIDFSWSPAPHARGTAVVWRVSSAAISSGEFEWLMNRPRGVCFALILPAPSEIAGIGSLLPRLAQLDPNVVLPSGRLVSPNSVRRALSGGPKDLPNAVVNYLWRHKVLSVWSIRSEVLQIFRLAPAIPTISRLCREMYLSRRTLGRHFEAYDLPVPSHWLQFARVLHVLLRAQSDTLALCKLALSLGYPDGFTFSNQVKRLTGLRPSEARLTIGYEWLLEAWLSREKDWRDTIAKSTDETVTGDTQTEHS